MVLAAGQENKGRYEENWCSIKNEPAEPYL